MRCHTVVNTERHKLAPKLSEKKNGFFFSMAYQYNLHESTQVGKSNTKSLLFTPSVQQLFHETRKETELRLQESAFSRSQSASSHFGHPAHSAVLSPSAHVPCKRISLPLLNAVFVWHLCFQSIFTEYRRHHLPCHELPFSVGCCEASKP